MNTVCTNIRQKFPLLVAIITIVCSGGKGWVGSMNWTAQGSMATIGFSDCVVSKTKDEKMKFQNSKISTIPDKKEKDPELLCLKYIGNNRYHTNGQKLKKE